MAYTVHVENFQSLLDVTVEVKGFTVVTGTNNAGKSAFMRAIRGAFQNARGTAFIRHGKTKAVVEIKFGDGHTLRWEKGKGPGDKPTFIVDGGKPMYPGQGVPDEVRALGVRPIMVGGREVWPQFAPQFTGQIFLLDQPGSVLAEAVSDINHVSQLNEALRLAESDKRSAASELKVRVADQVVHEANVKKYDGLDDVDAEITAIEAEAAKAAKIAAVVQTITGMQTRLNAAKGAVAALEGVEAVDVPDDAVSFKEAATLLMEIHALTGLKNRLEVANAAVAKLAAIPDVEALDTADVEALWDQFSALVDIRNRLAKAQTQVLTIDGEVDAADEKFVLCIKEVETALEGLGECPVCGTLHKGGHS